MKTFSCRLICVAIVFLFVGCTCVFPLPTVEVTPLGTTKLAWQQVTCDGTLTDGECEGGAEILDDEDIEEVFAEIENTPAPQGVEGASSTLGSLATVTPIPVHIDASVAASLQSEFPAPSGKKWVGFKTDMVTLPANGHYNLRLTVLHTDVRHDVTFRARVAGFSWSDGVEQQVTVGGGPTGIGGGGATFALRPTNPMKGPLDVSFSLSSADRALLAVYDLTGRQVVRREVGSSGPGWHTVKLGSLPAGVYLVRLSQAGRSLSARLAVIR
jgi:hypothetical protein